MKWTKSGFDGFRKGTFGNGGQNLYVTASGTLQRIFNFDVNGDGYPDLPIANSHSMNEKPEIYIYDEIGQKKPLKLPTNGAFDAIEDYDFADDGYSSLYTAIKTMHDEYIPVVRPDFEGFYDKTDALYAGLREMQPSLIARAENGENIDELTEEIWEFFCSID